MLTSVRGVHVHPDVFVVGHLSDLVQVVERTATGCAQGGHHEERNQAVRAVLLDCVAQRVTSQLVLTVRGQSTEQHAAQQTRSLHGRVRQLGRVSHEFGHDVRVRQLGIGLLQRLQCARLRSQQRHKRGLASRALQRSGTYVVLRCVKCSVRTVHVHTQYTNDSTCDVKQREGVLECHCLPFVYHSNQTI